MDPSRVRGGEQRRPRPAVKRCLRLVYELSTPWWHSQMPRTLPIQRQSPQMARRRVALGLAQRRASGLRSPERTLSDPFRSSKKVRQASAPAPIRRSGRCERQCAKVGGPGQHELDPRRSLAEGPSQALRGASTRLRFTRSAAPSASSLSSEYAMRAAFISWSCSTSRASPRQVGHVARRFASAVARHSCARRQNGSTTLPESCWEGPRRDRGARRRRGPLHSQVPLRERTARSGLQVPLESRGATLVSELNQHIDFPRPVLRRVMAGAIVVCV